MIYIITAAVLISGYILTGLLIYIFQNRIVYVPCREIFKTPEDMGMEYEDLDLTTSDGLKINAWFIPGNGRDETVLLCHGNGGSLSHRLDTISLLHKMGFPVFIFDYRGYGISEGVPSEQGTYIDAETALNYLLKEKGIPEGKIICWGRSLGGPIAANLARKRNFHACVIESTFTSILDMASFRFKVFPSKLLVKFNYRTMDYVKDISVPLLVVHSPEDEVIPFWMGKKVFQNANEPKTFLELKGDHNNTYFDSLDVYKPGLEKFFADIKG